MLGVPKLLKGCVSPQVWFTSVGTIRPAFLSASKRASVARCLDYGLSAARRPIFTFLMTPFFAQVANDVQLTKPGSCGSVAPTIMG